MNLSISNIAWSKKEEFDVISILKKNNIFNIEIALTKINENWKITKQDLIDYKKIYSDFNIYSIQSLNYNTEYNLFDNNLKFKNHIKFTIDCAEILNSKILIFGSPKNRRINNNMSYSDAEDIFINTMIEIGDHCKKNEIYFCIEPNSKQYNCNFITNSYEAVQIINKINHKNIGLHLDAACMHMENDFGLNEKNIFEKIKHFHISEPFLNNFSNTKVNHELYSKFLKDFKYIKSIEMKYDELRAINNITNAIDFAKKVYS
jgi:sugar phosphate isomerase/epimerase